MKLITLPVSGTSTSFAVAHEVLHSCNAGVCVANGVTVTKKFQQRHVGGALTQALTCCALGVHN